MMYRLFNRIDGFRLTSMKKSSNIYRRTLHKLAQKFTPHPRKLFGKEWTTNCQTAFDTLKEHLVTAPILSYAKFDETFIVETDARTVVPNDLAANIQSVSRISVNTEESFVTLPTLDRPEIKNLQKRDTVIGKFIEIWNTKRKPLRSEQQKFERPLVTLLRKWDRTEVEDG
ncbi:unnamed protein product [Mytilus edulis]|uniref:Reverse transcriptase/retrotransposon-derived protein RNase H-like domain-containing protein n=1 Tax=Mytilus edulis TaxID=6550 RepID=A0A8S3SJY8_MYTED|nr:unnamed protein product [Mytilus edulis]